MRKEWMIATLKTATMDDCDDQNYDCYDSNDDFNYQNDDCDDQDGNDG